MKLIAFRCTDHASVKRRYALPPVHSLVIGGRHTKSDLVDRLLKFDLAVLYVAKLIYDNV